MSKERPTIRTMIVICLIVGLVCLSFLFLTIKKTVECKQQINHPRAYLFNGGCCYDEVIYTKGEYVEQSVCLGGTK